MQTAALWYGWDVGYSGLSLSQGKLPMWGQRYLTDFTRDVSTWVHFLLPVICGRCWLHLVKTILKSCSWVKERRILKDTVPHRGLSFGAGWGDPPTYPHLNMMTREPTNTRGSREQNPDTLHTPQLPRSWCRTAGKKLFEYWRRMTHSKKDSGGI